MAADQWPTFEVGEVFAERIIPSRLFLLKMWPEASRRVGVTEREFPSGVIRRWQQEMSGGNWLKKMPGTGGFHLRKSCTKCGPSIIRARPNR